MGRKREPTLMADRGRIEEIVVFSGNEEREDEMPEVFAGSVLAMELDQGADLFLRAVCHDAGEFSFEKGFAGDDTEIGGAGEVAIGREFVEFGDFLERLTKFRPNRALCVKSAD